MPRPVTGCVRMSGVADQSGSALTLILAYDPNPNPYLNQKPSPHQKPNPITLTHPYPNYNSSPNSNPNSNPYARHHLVDALQLPPVAPAGEPNPDPPPNLHTTLLVTLTLFNSTLP